MAAIPSGLYIVTLVSSDRPLPPPGAPSVVSRQPGEPLTLSSGPDVRPWRIEADDSREGYYSITVDGPRGDLGKPGWGLPDGQVRPNAQLILTGLPDLKQWRIERLSEDPNSAVFIKPDIDNLPIGIELLVAPEGPEVRIRDFPVTPEPRPAWFLNQVFD